VGSSWGTIIGSLAVQHAPEKLAAYVGPGQMVDPFATDRLMWSESIRDAQGRDDRSAVKLRAIGPPPYDDTLDYPIAISSNPKWIQFTHGEDYSANSEYPASLFVREYSLVEQLRGMAAIAETFHVLYPQLRDTDFRVDVPSLKVPVHLVEGRHEVAGRSTLARNWCNALGTRQAMGLLPELRTHNALRRAQSVRPSDGRPCSPPPASQQHNLRTTPGGTFGSTHLSALSTSLGTVTSVIRQSPTHERRRELRS
jgi:hypothetical protein